MAKPNYFAAVALQVAISASKVLACSCGPPPPPCEGYGSAQMVFLATVTEVLNEAEWGVTRARVRVDHGYKGVSEKVLILSNDGMCSGPNLVLGDQYLLYTSRFEGGDVPANGCSRSRNVRFAEEDLQFLNQLDDAEPVAKVFGKVVIQPDMASGDNQPAAGARVELSSPERKYLTTTDSEGSYSFLNVEPATYYVDASLDGYRVLSFGAPELPPVPVEARACAVSNIVLRKNWAGVVAGRLIRSNGESASSGIVMQLLQLVKKDGEDTESVRFEQIVTSDERGEYRFANIVPGRYKIVANLHEFPTTQSPYRAIYWPAAARDADAFVVAVGDEPPQRRYDFRLPAEPESRIVEGIVHFADGRPAPGVSILITANPGESCSNNTITGEEGRFSLIAFQGFDYELRAIFYGPRSWHSAPFGFSAKQGTLINLLLDRPGRFDEDPFELVRGR